ncbi:type III-A CRISPR-associated protein Cas10/Csm1 [Nostoc sp. FACHB-87]|uniref:type III-A CRISPR-associated protein Cas10/Csm1 n=1 Tax=Nostocaceae TaxID=1162 RepID=UPI001684B40B|nr:MULTISPECIES: type III-A CRISPR-associated protein Cas10/Csm1 [Nostocaceae]MBD2456631.1 type III-A CRISPR-associated protein Cas10/Csm1 [Nostoc sp. FACHB-87]MBD2477980.1 type III-A CRISPR-associated protein Cas10/Csm1 [Anabaena sp. FACHB-83]
MTHTQKSFNVALRVIQESVNLIIKWVDPKLVKKPYVSLVEDYVEEAKQILSWPSHSQPDFLRLIFDSVKIYQRHDKEHYWFPKIIEDNNPIIHYPDTNKPSDDILIEIKSEIKQYINILTDDDWNNLSLLTLFIEKFASFLSLGAANVSLLDMARTTAAVAVALINNPDSEVSLISGDLSGIKKFIYTISSDGALKSLRARSFYLELVTEEVVQQLLSRLEIPRTNVIYAGGGNLYILASGTEENKKIVQQVRQQFNKWLLEEFQGKVFLALDCLNFPVKELACDKFSSHWSNATKNLAVHKSQKFADQISNFIIPSHSHEPCRVCHRDDVELEKLKPLNKNEPDSVIACETCRSMFDLGSNLFGVKAIVRSSRENVDSKLPTLSFKLPAIDDSPAVNIYYHCFKTWKPIVPESDTVLLVNDWNLEHYQFKHFKNVSTLLLGNYGKESETDKNHQEEVQGFMRAEEMAAKAKGIDRVGYLKIDVDKLGQIFAKGLGENQSLPRLAGLSRQINYFFKVYLNSLANQRNINIPDQITQPTTKNEPYNILFIYAGGDDVFISGAWNEIVDFSFDVYQCFRAYTGNNPNITLSGGISIDDAKFPLYQSAESSDNAEKAAKNNGRDSLSLFGQVFKWDEWLGISRETDFDTFNKNYKNPETNKPSLLGILPFVQRLEQQNIGVNYARNFVRNLLITAQIQEQALKKFEEDNKSEEALGTRYYLHLPKIAYTLARLPKNVLDDNDFRTSLKSPYNAPYFRAIATWIELLNR